MKNNAGLPYKINNANNSNAMYMYMMQCMMMNGGNRNIMMNPFQHPQMSNNLNMNFALGFNQPYSMNPNTMSAYYKMNQRQRNNSYQLTDRSKSRINRESKGGYNYNNYQPHQSQFLKDFDYEFDMLTRKREREGEGEEKQSEMTIEDIEDINKWLEQRKKNYPSRQTIERKTNEGEMKEDKGMISQLELRLRKKNQLLQRIDYKPRRVNMYRNASNNRNRNDNYNHQTQNSNSKPVNLSQKNDIEEGELIEEIVTAKPQCSTNISKSNKQLNLKPHPKTKLKQHNSSLSFKYKQNNIYEMMLKQEKIIEANILLQAFRYFEKEQLI